MTVSSSSHDQNSGVLDLDRAAESAASGPERLRSLTDSEPSTGRVHLRLPGAISAFETGELEPTKLSKRQLVLLWVPYGTLMCRPDQCPRCLRDEGNLRRSFERWWIAGWGRWWRLRELDAGFVVGAACCANKRTHPRTAQRAFSPGVCRLAAAGGRHTAGSG